MADMIRAEPFSSVYVLDTHFHYKDMGVVNVFNSPAGRAVISTTNQRPPFCQNRRTHSDVTKFVLSPENLIASDLQNRNINSTQNMFLSKSEGRISEYKKTDTGPVNNSDFFRDSNTTGDSSSSTVNFKNGSVKGDDFRDSDSNAQLTRRIVNRNNVESNPVNNSSNGLVPPLDRSQSLNAEDSSGHETKSSSKSQQDGSDLVTYKSSKLTKFSSDKDVMKRHYNRRFSDEKCDILRRLLSGFLSGWTAGTGAEIARWRKRKSSEELYREASLALGIPCELTDSCRCLECQCHYFDCGDTESDTSDVSINLYDCENEDWPRDGSILPDTAVMYETESTILKIPDSLLKTETLSACLDEEMRLQSDEDDLAGADIAILQQDGDDDDPEICNNEMAAGTPVILDHLLNNPMTCVLQ